MRYFTFFFVILSLQQCLPHLNHISVGTSHISGAQELRVAIGPAGLGGEKS